MGFPCIVTDHYDKHGYRQNLPLSGASWKASRSAIQARGEAEPIKIIGNKPRKTPLRAAITLLGDIPWRDAG
jgi:hypothetical protein